MSSSCEATSRSWPQSIFSSSNLRVGRELYARAVDEDPRFAPAWARLGRCQYLIGKVDLIGAGDEDRAQTLARAEACFQKALELSPDLPLAHNLYALLEIDARLWDARTIRGGNVLDNPNEAIRFGERQRSQEDRVDDTEDRGVGAYAEGQCGDGDCGEAGRSADGAQGVAEILFDALQPRQQFDLTARLAVPHQDCELSRGLGSCHVSIDSLPHQIAGPFVEMKADLLARSRSTLDVRKVFTSRESQDICPPLTRV